MIDFAQIVRENRPKLRDTSVTAYAMSLKTLAPPDANSLEFLKDTEAVFCNRFFSMWKIFHAFRKSWIYCFVARRKRIF